MAKRFTDSEKWKDPWFRKLPPIGKCIWIFMLDNCDHAGIWKVDIEAMNFHIGSDWTKPMIKECLNGRITEIKGGDEWFLSDFIEFQYNVLPKDLDKKNRVHYSVLQILKNKGLTRGLIAPKDKDKDKDMDKDQDKEVNIEFSKFWDLYDYKKNKDECEKLWIGKKKRRDGKKINDEERSLIMSHLPKYVESTFKNGEYPGRSHPHTYLNNKQWEDEIPVPEKPHSNRKKESIKFIFICPTHPKNSVHGETKNDYHTCRVLVENVAGIKKECGEKMVLEDVISLGQVFSQIGVE